MNTEPLNEDDYTWFALDGWLPCRHENCIFRKQLGHRLNVPLVVRSPPLLYCGSDLLVSTATRKVSKTTGQRKLPQQLCCMLDVVHIVG